MSFAKPIRLALYWGVLLLSISGGDSTSALPKTCSELKTFSAKEANGTPPQDGTYTLYVEGKKTHPWEAYCKEMDTTSPQEFLTVTELIRQNLRSILPIVHFQRIPVLMISPSCFQAAWILFPLVGRNFNPHKVMMGPQQRPRST